MWVVGYTVLEAAFVLVPFSTDSPLLIFVNISKWFKRFLRVRIWYLPRAIDRSPVITHPHYHRQSNATENLVTRDGFRCLSIHLCIEPIPRTLRVLAEKMPETRTSELTKAPELVQLVGYTIKEHSPHSLTLKILDTCIKQRDYCGVSPGS